MKKIIAIALTIIFMGTSTVKADSMWTGSGVYYPDRQGAEWNVAASDIIKISNPASVYRVGDIDRYSAYVSNSPERIGNSMEKSFAWHNKSRLAYVKLFKVSPGQKLSFVFSKTYYVYFAEYDKNYKLLNDGQWLSTGDVCTLGSNTQWVIMVFRQVNGDLATGGGQDTSISVEEISKTRLNYVLFDPFTYTFNLDGGKYNNSSRTFTMERLGVEKIKLPEPVKSGYVFDGWMAENGKLYKGTIPAEYDENIFKSCTFTAKWSPVQVKKITPEYTYRILEAECSDFFAINVKISPVDAPDKKLKYESSDETVAKVDKNGIVTAYNTGTADIKISSSNGVYAVCKVYVMGFEVILPDECEINKPYAVKVNIYNNGEKGMDDRKSVVLNASPGVAMYRVGDEDTSYNVTAQMSLKEDSGYTYLKSDSDFVNTSDSVTVYYKVTPDKKISKAGDYMGNINFCVAVK